MLFHNYCKASIISPSSFIPLEYNPEWLNTHIIETEKKLNKNSPQNAEKTTSDIFNKHCCLYSTNGQNSNKK